MDDARGQDDGRDGQTPDKGAPKPIAIGLQGGGAHGAFAWGVLDRLLEDGRIEVEGISATSAGAMNAAVLAYGLLQGGSDGARTALRDFWRDISRSAAAHNPFRKLPWEKHFHPGHSLEHSPMFLLTDWWLRLLSPYEFNPLNVNPLRDVLARHVDFAALRQSCPIRLYLCATNVQSGKMRIFSSEEMSIDAVMASACLPLLFQAVQIDGEYYWDGGYVGNPAIFPLIYHCGTRDVVIVHINPILRKGVPKTASEILNRINEVSFNSTLMRELRTIGVVTSMIQQGKLSGGGLKEVMIHSIRSDETMSALGISSKFNADWDFLSLLHEQGRAQAETWLQENYQHIGLRSSVDLQKEFL